MTTTAAYYDQYDPTAPRISDLILEHRLKKIARVQAERDRTRPYHHNPLILEHMIQGARYTFDFCRKCTASWKCNLHYHPKPQSVSVPLCKHVDLKLYWSVDDPVNHKSTWALRRRTYLNSHKQQTDHVHCVVKGLYEQVGALSNEVLRQMAKMQVRSNPRRIRDELYALVGAVNRAEEESERKKLEAQIRILQQLQILHVKKRKTSSGEGEPIDSIEAVDNVEGRHTKKRKVSIDNDEVIPTVETSTMQPTPLKSVRSSLEPGKLSPHRPDAEIQTPPATPPRRLPESPGSDKTSEPSTPIMLMKKVKKVRWASEIKDDDETVHPRLWSPAFTSGEGSLSPTARGDELEAEIVTIEDFEWSEGGDAESI